MCQWFLLTCVMTEIVLFLMLQSARVPGINPVASHIDSTALGSAVTYLQTCFYPAIHQLEYSETLHHMNGKQIHLDSELHRVEDHIASAVSQLRSLVKSDPRLTIGIECRIPQVQCILSQNLTHVSAVSATAMLVPIHNYRK